MKCCGLRSRGGIILINAPDYRNSYEEHYGIDFQKSLIEHKEEFGRYLFETGRDLTTYNELNFIQVSDIYDELKKYMYCTGERLEIINLEESNPKRRVIIRDHKVICNHQIAFVVKKI